MKRICAWCKKRLPSTVSDDTDDGIITHGICDDCAAFLSSDRRRGVLDFLNTLSEPVFLVDGEGTFLSANTAARQQVGKDSAEIERRLGGEVFECANADLPGGCGQTELCQSCTIRNTVLQTLDSGRGAKNITAALSVKTPDGVRETRLLISTEKVGDTVLLRIDDMQ